MVKTLLIVRCRLQTALFHYRGRLVPSGKVMTMKKRTMVLIVVIALFALAAAMVLCAVVFLPVDTIRRFAEGKASEALDMPVRTGHIGISFAGIPALKISDIVIGPPEESDQPLATIRSVRVRINLLRLLKKEVEIVSVELNKPSVHYVVSGHDTPAKTRTTPSYKRSSPTKLLFPVMLRKFSVRNGSATVGFPASGLTVRLEDFSQRLSIKADSELKAVRSTGTLVIGNISLETGSPPDSIGGVDLRFVHELSGDLTSGHLILTRGDLKVNGVPLSITGETTGLSRVQFNIGTGTVDIDRIIEAIPPALVPGLDNISLEGTLSLSLAGNADTGTKPPAVSFTGRLDCEAENLSWRGFPRHIDSLAIHAGFTDETITLDSATLSTGSSRLDISGTAASYRDNPVLSLSAQGSIDAGEVAGSFPVLRDHALDGTIGLAVTATVSPADISSLEARGEITVDRFSLALPKVLNHPLTTTGSIKLSPSAVTLERFDVTSGKSDFAITGTLSSYQSVLAPCQAQPATFSGTLSSAFTDFGDLIFIDKKTPMIKPWDLREPIEQTPLPPNLSLALDVRLKTLAFGRLRADSFTGAATFANGRLALSNLTAAAYNGTFRGAVVLDVADIDSATYRGGFTLDGLDSGVFLPDFFGTSDFLQGKLSGTLEFAGAGLDSLDMLENLTGSGSLRFDNGRFVNWEFTKQLGPHLPFLDFDTLEFDSMVNSFNIAHKRVTFSDMTVTGRHCVIRVNGSSGFDTSIDCDLVFTLDEETSREAIRRLSVLADIIGTDVRSLELVVRAEGTLASPRFTVDTSRAKNLIKEQARDHLKTRIEKIVDEKIRDESLKEEGKKLIKKLFR